MSPWNLIRRLFRHLDSRADRRIAAMVEASRGVVLVVDDPSDPLEPLNGDDRALVELGGEATYRPGDRIALASGRIITGWELAQLAPHRVTLTLAGDVDRFMAEQLEEPAFREAYTALPGGDLMALAQHVDVDPQPTVRPDDVAAGMFDHIPTLGQETGYDPDVMVPYGPNPHSAVHRRCREARKVDPGHRDICKRCSSVFSGGGGRNA